MATSIAVTLPRPTVASSSAFTVTMLREYITTDLSDAALQTYLDAAFEAIEDVLGPLVVTERFLRVAGDALMLSREASSVVSVIENAYTGTDVLAADNYELSSTGHTLRRLGTGSTPARSWTPQVRVSYQREDDTATRIAVAVVLVNLAITNTDSAGLAEQTIGTWTERYRESAQYQKERASILAALAENQGIF